MEAAPQITLEKLCLSLGILTRALQEEEISGYRDNHPLPEYIISPMVDMDKVMGHNVVLIGGICAHPMLLGFRQMRRTSNDLDCITDDKGIRDLHTKFNGQELFFRTANFGDLFLDYKGLPFVFDD